MSASNVRLIGILELLAALGLILPHLTGILPWLTPLAAAGLVLTMIGAAALHIQRGDGAQAVVGNIVFLPAGKSRTPRKQPSPFIPFHRKKKQPETE